MDGSMISDFNLKINNMGPINYADIDIGKINVIGGLNATGKSTASKLLYCFLKGNIEDRQEFAYSLISNLIIHILISNNYSPMEVFKFSIDELLEYYNELKVNLLENSTTSQLNQIIKIDEILEIIEKNDKNLYEFLFNSLISSEFSSLNSNGNLCISGVYNNNSFNYDIKLTNNSIDNKSLEGFFSLSNIFYIDSFSVLDTKYFELNNMKNERSYNLIKSLDEDLNESSKLFDDEVNNKIIGTEEKIVNVIKGTFSFDDDNLYFTNSLGHKTLIEDTSSGIKQIGVIQLLLSFRKLKKNSFLIIDEPEVNLHPNWQISFAEILSILAKDLNINIYINTHSPMFIEAMSVFSEYYGLLDETYFYLTEKDDDNGFYFKKIAHNNMGAVYQNLAKPYEILDRIKARLSEKL